MSTKTKQCAIDATLNLARVALPAFEASPLGEPWAAFDAEAARAVADVKARAREALFPSEIRPVDPEVFAAFEFLEEDADLSSYVSHLADVHARAVSTYPELAAFVRSPAVLARVRRVAASLAQRQMRTSEDVGRELVEALSKAVAGQLAGTEEFEPAATVLATDVPAMEARLDAARARHEQYARAEIERIEAEKAEADEALAAEERRLRDDLIQFFGARGSRPFSVGARIFSGLGIAAIAAGEAARDIVDQEFGSAPLDALRMLKLETEAAEAVSGHQAS